VVCFTNTPFSFISLRMKRKMKAFNMILSCE
jgi:hypothetical protein